MNYLTIGVAGQIGSGKNTIADYICDKMNFSNETGHWIRKGFADAVKKLYMETFDVSWEFVEEWKRIPEAPPGFEKSVRESLIFIGDGFRSINPNIWIDIAFRNIKYNQIFSDIRYINEANHIKNNNGINLLIWRPGHENDIQNESEQQIMPFVNELKVCSDKFDCVMLNNSSFPFDMFVVNDGDVKLLYKKLDELVFPQLLKWSSLFKTNGGE